MRSVPLLLAALAMTACGPRTVRATVPVSPEEQVLLEQITRDPFLVLTETWRNDEGRLVVVTRQGEVTRAYVLAPEIEGAKEPLIRRRIDDFELPTGAPEAESHRGLQRER